MKKIDSKGFSLIELILVIAIMGVLVGGSMNIIGYVGLGNVKKCANMINSYIGEVRSDALSQAEAPYLIVYKCSKGIYAYKTTLSGADTEIVNLDGSEGERLTGQSIDLTYTNEAGSQTMPDVSSESITVADLKDKNNAIQNKVIVIKFKKSTGAISDSVNFCSNMKVKKNARTYSINLIKDTGRYYIE